MADINIKSFDELKDIITKHLKEGTVISIDISGKEKKENDENNAKRQEV